MIGFLQVLVFNLRNITHYPHLQWHNLAIDAGTAEASDGVLRVNGKEYLRIKSVHGEEASNFGWDLEHASKQIVRRRDSDIFSTEGGLAPL